MKPTALDQLESFWEDLIDVFFDILPPDLVIVRMIDQWYERSEVYDLRRRTLQLSLVSANNVSLSEICEDIAIAASGDGWLMVPTQEEKVYFFLERGDENLIIQSSDLEKDSTITIVIDQAWPSDVHPPVNSSMTFLNVCQKVLKIHDFPIYLEKDLIFDLENSTRVKWMQEKIQYKDQGDLRGRVKVAGYIRSKDQDFVWYQTTDEPNHSLRACVIFDDSEKIVELTLIKENRSQALNN